MLKWYIVQVFSSQEKKVKKAIEDQKSLSGMDDLIEQVLLPTENVSEVKKGQQRVVERRMWPGYLLIKMVITDESWQFIKNVPGVFGFAGGEKPTALRDSEVEEILRDLEDKKKKVTQKHNFAVGDKVKIIEGVFINFSGVVTDVSHEKGRVSVLVSIFGRDTRVDDLEFNQIEEIAEGNDSA